MRADTQQSGRDDRDDESDPYVPEVQILLEVSVVCLIDAGAERVPDRLHALAGPETHESGADDRVGFEAEDQFPEPGTVGQVRVPAQHRQDFIFDVKRGIQHVVSEGGDGKDRDDPRRLARNEFDATQHQDAGRDDQAHQ
jgi:hypothetical protein